MSIEGLERLVDDIIKTRSGLQAYLPEIINYIIAIFKDQSDMIADIYKELAQKENVIDVNNIKEINNVNNN